MATKEDLERIKKRIRALMTKTTENGATEAEAMAAAEKARAMMDYYQIDVTAAQIEREEVDLQTSHIFEKRLDRMIYIGNALGHYTDCRVWTHKNRVNFMGVGADAEMALYLFEMLVKTRDRELKAWRKTLDYKTEIANGHNGNALRTVFTDAFVNRVCERLKAAKDAEKTEAANHSRALVPVKNAIVERELKRRIGGLTTRSAAASKGTSRAAARAGAAAGSRAGFNGPISGNRSTPRLH